jgi:hypothetical protein
VQLRPDLVEARGGLSDDEVDLLERELGIAYPATSPDGSFGADAP